ncbi:complex I subunit 5 family protein [Archaeoglobus profundus]|uniref:complex I subunit 5 family protein n=1 Tax=Archaeoglobus profundus TaxID=84156 RepID=UPI001FE05D7B|nr:complex I subunit 5 family protein [Archaeoglobus profundus]
MIRLIEVAIPLVALIIAPLIVRGHLITSLAYVLSCILIALKLTSRGYIHLLSFPSPVGDFYLFSDGISNIFGFTIALISSMVALYSYPYMKHRFEEMGLGEGEFRKYWFLYNLYAYSMLLLVYSANLLLLYVFLEISLVSSFLLIYYYGYGNRRWVALLYFVWTHVAGVLTLIGFIIVGLKNQTLLMPYIKVIPMVAWILIFLGMVIKLPGLGFHIWLPYAHAEAPTPVSALLSPLTVGLAGYILLRIYEIDPSFVIKFRDQIFLYGFLTSFVAGLIVFKQRDFKRLLAYSTVSQMGYMLMALCLGTYGMFGLVIQYVSHAFGKSILFMSAGALIMAYHLRDIEKMGGLHEQVPEIANASLLGFMNLSGIVTIGLLGEFFILRGVVEFYGIGRVAMMVIVAFIISGLYSFYTMKRIYYGKPKDYPSKRIALSVKIPLYVIGLISIITLFTAKYIVDALMEVFA